MFGRTLARDRNAGRIATALYGAIVAQARAPAFYADFGVPDTVSGRFEMVVLHAALVLDRLGDGGTEEQAVGQRVFDLFCTDMDRSLRELGVGDLGIPRRMKQVGEAFYGRARAYRDAWGAAANGAPAALVDALYRNVFKTTGSDGGARALAGYVASAAAQFAAMLGAPPLFPEPAVLAESPA